MEEYMNLSDPLNELGLFVADAKRDLSPVNENVSSLPTMTEWLQSLRSYNIYYPGQLTTNHSEDYSNDMDISFIDLLKQEGLNITVTSTHRPGARTAQGKASYHGRKDEWGNSMAVDFRAADGNTEKLLQNIYNNPRICAWLRNHGRGIIEETSAHPDIRRSTGADRTAKGGDLLHMGPDTLARRMSSNRGLNYNISNTPRILQGQKMSLKNAGWDISKPFLGIGKYRTNLNWRVSLTKEQLWEKDQGLSHNIRRDNLIGDRTVLGSNLARNHNNPCNISPSKGDRGYIKSSRAADGQKYAGYDTIVNGLAATMRLYLRQYNNRSIRSINCDGFLGRLSTARKQYSTEDWKALENLRLLWITHVSDTLGISPFMRLNLNDKETMFSLIEAVAKQESLSRISRRDLEAAWKLI